MRFPKRVQSEMKGGVDVTLGPRTVLVGRNGSGKSAVVQSIELASLGCVTDMEGRQSVSKPGTLARLFPGKKRSVRIEWSDGTLFTWELMDGPRAGSFKEPEVLRPFQPRFLVSELMELFSREEAAVRSWLEAQVFGAVAIEDVVAAIGKSFERQLRDLAAAAGKTDFLGLAEEARSQTRSLRTRATSQEKTIEKLTQGLAAPLTDSERRKLEAELAAISGKGIEPAAYAAAEAEAAAVRSRLAVPLPESVKHRKMLTNLQEHLRSHIEKYSGKECFTCGSHADLEARLAEVETLLAALPGRELEAARRVDEVRLRDLEAILAQPVDVHQAKRRSMQELLYGDAEARKAWDNAQKSRAEVVNMRTEAGTLEQIAGQLDSYGRLFLKARKSAFEQKITPLLGVDFGLDLDAGRVGMQRGDHVHTALSGVEEARVLLALGAALEISDAIMVPKDRAWDEETLATTMEALQTAQTPILIMSTVLPTRPVDGWTLVEL